MKKALLLLSLTLATVLAPVQAQTYGYFTYSSTKTNSYIEGDWLGGRYEVCHWKVDRTFHSYSGGTRTAFYAYTTTTGSRSWWGTPPSCPSPSMP